MDPTDTMTMANDDQLSSNYRRYHESYMENLNGTSALETYFLIVPSVLNLYICTHIIYFILPFFELKITKLRQFLFEFVIIVVPIVLWMTQLADYIRHIFLILLIISVCILSYLFQFMQVVDVAKLEVTNTRRKFLTNARSIINLITAICILAVDFKVFPRRFAKTETFGFSLMDLGVGLYVFSNGIVASPHVKEQHSNFLQTMSKTFLSCTPLFVLGSVRFVLTNELDYQQHVSEYGVHWNFFMTLASTKLLSTIILYCIPFQYSTYLTILILAVHEYLLKNGWQQWVLSDVQRSTFLTANREGLVSSLGYVGIYLVAIQTGTFMRLREITTFRQNIQLLYKLILLSTFALICTVITEDMFGISRRLANSAYICWIFFIAVTMATYFLAVELCLVFVCAGMRKYFELKHSHVVHFNEIACVQLEAINYNGLTFFLLANVLTGLINLTVHTLTLDTTTSLLIIIGYIFVICAVMNAAYIHNIKLKFW